MKTTFIYSKRCLFKFYYDLPEIYLKAQNGGKQLSTFTHVVYLSIKQENIT